MAATEGQHTAQLRLEAEVKAASANVKKFQGEIDRLQKKVDTLSQKQKKASGSLDRLQQSMEKASSLVSKVTTGFGVAGLAGAIGIGVAAVDKAMTSMMRYQNVMANVPFRIDAAKSATLGLVDSFTLAQQAVEANRFGVATTAKEFANLTSIATKLALSTGKDATKAVQDLTLALARQSPMILDNLGISLKLSEAYDRYAKSIGTVASQLTDAQKKIAFSTEALKAGEEAAKNVTLEVDNAATAWAKLKVGLSDFADFFGDDFIKSINKDIEIFVRQQEKVFGLLRLVRGEVGFQGVRGGRGRTRFASEREERRFQEQRREEERERLRQDFGEGPTPEHLAELHRFREEERERRGASAAAAAKRASVQRVKRLEKELDAIFLAEAEFNAKIREMAAETAEWQRGQLERRFDQESEFRRRRIELMEARGEDASLLREAQMQQEIAHINRLIEVAETREQREDLIDQRREIRHQRQIRRIEAEMEAFRKQEQVIAQISQQVSASLGSAAFAAIDSSKAFGLAFAEEVTQVVRAQARILAVRGFAEIVTGTAMLIALNPLGSLHLLAGAKYLAGAAAVGAMGLGLQAGTQTGVFAPGGRAGGRAPSRGFGENITPQGQQLPSAATNTNQDSDLGKAVGGDVVVVNANMLTPSEEAGAVIAQSVKRARQSGARVDMGA